MAKIIHTHVHIHRKAKVRDAAQQVDKLGWKEVRYLLAVKGGQQADRIRGGNLVRKSGNNIAVYEMVYEDGRKRLITVTNNNGNLTADSGTRDNVAQTFDANSAIPVGTKVVWSEGGIHKVGQVIGPDPKNPDKGSQVKRLNSGTVVALLNSQLRRSYTDNATEGVRVPAKAKDCSCQHASKDRIGENVDKDIVSYKGFAIARIEGKWKITLAPRGYNLNEFGKYNSVQEAKKAIDNAEF